MWQSIPMSTPLNCMLKTSNLEATLIPGSLSFMSCVVENDSGEKAWDQS